jgi:hypothetical protein
MTADECPVTSIRVHLVLDVHASALSLNEHQQLHSRRTLDLLEIELLSLVLANLLVYRASHQQQQISLARCCLQEHYTHTVRGTFKKSGPCKAQNDRR